MCKNENECRGRMARNQEEALIGMLFLARDRNLSVVLHCRDNGTGQAASKTLQVTKETGLTDLKYHRHCFTGTYEELLEWRSLPHVRVGGT
jgi:Tat protein secretion system quality control protein TatD with DNase activity